MFKTILVPVRGDGGDKASLDTAFAVATLFGSHIEVAHIKDQLLVSATGSVQVRPKSSPDCGYVSALRKSCQGRWSHVRWQYRQFRSRTKIPEAAVPQKKLSISAAWTDHDGNEIERIIGIAHGHDIIVLHAALTGKDGFSPEEAGEIILSRSGPVMLALRSAVRNRSNNRHCMEKHAGSRCGPRRRNAAPLSRRQNPCDVRRRRRECTRSISRRCDVIERLRWHGLNAVADPIKSGRSSPATSLMEHVESRGADLLVMGAYGRNRMRELIFGSFTKCVLSGASLPVFLSH